MTGVGRKRSVWAYRSIALCRSLIEISFFVTESRWGKAYPHSVFCTFGLLHCMETSKRNPSFNNPSDPTRRSKRPRSIETFTCAGRLV
eukprot:scaffold7109_cov63-Phaeocystis_antarctica.AAC.3